ncbi:hypothetical protein FK535_13580 [Mycolicibacterium sp. 018/SC-01/001]|uniref:hypothetical protein n=1 Tax=Mycolicibacterium sp. 018/SC-01/001 TaxID=2592069 RepID=UPI00117FB9E7|nr:hypothetical protein [Mycolicibacterium sp. 018/SC-01/001]TRW82413.1 hypothetical protein FK535_13580 [Mycolicibacterium sp. 018/SC-01/001]
MRLITRLCVAALLGPPLAACTGPTVITTDDTVTAPPASPSAPETTRPSNVHLANAFTYAIPGAADGTTVYAFTTPSGRWQCQITPRTQASCGKAGTTATAIGITGAPDEVPAADGETATPTALLVDRTGAPQFAALPASTIDDPPVLPFNRILAVAGFRCNVQEASGVSCLSELSGKGFTFSADGFTTAYTDVPADAP